MASRDAAIQPERTAMRRVSLSRPISLALSDELIGETTSVLDYGCGRGDDVRRLRRLGHTAWGWDPNFAPDVELKPADLVNLGYVINVIQDPLERARALREAWSLSRNVLVVSARLRWEEGSAPYVPQGDGFVTRSNTFQKFYSQEELRAWIESTLSLTTTTAAPGVFYVFRSSEDRQQYLARRTRIQRSTTGVRLADLLFEHNRDLLEPLTRFVKDNRRLPKVGEAGYDTGLLEEFGSIRAAFAVIRRATGPAYWADVQVGPDRRTAEHRFERHKQLLQPLLDFVSTRGRIPHISELANADAICKEFGSIKSAFAFIRRLSGPDQWERITDECRQNLLVYLALSAFKGRVRLSELPDDLQLDVKAFFSTYRKACQLADRLLYSAGDSAEVDSACRTSPVGKLTQEALYIHTSAMGYLGPVLRVYEACARELTGSVLGATVLKLHRIKPQVSYLQYPKFLIDPHPSLEGVVIARLSRLEVDFRDFSKAANPPVLHRKELFIPKDHPDHQKFARLTLQEERRGLLDDQSTIGTRQGWLYRLSENGLALRGHRIVRSRDSSGA